MLTERLMRLAALLEIKHPVDVHLDPAGADPLAQPADNVDARAFRARNVRKRRRSPGISAYPPPRSNMSKLPIPASFTRISTSSSSIAGTGTSRMTRFSGPPSRSMTAAFIVSPSLVMPLTATIH